MESYSEKMLRALESEALDEAQLYLEQALREDSNDLLEELADNLYQLGFFEEAKRVYEKIVQEEPARDGLYLSLAEIAIEEGGNDEAFDYLDHITEASNYYPQKLLVSADLYQLLGIPEASEAKLKEAESLLPEEPLIQFALGEFYLWNTQYALALTAYQKVQAAGIDKYGEVLLVERMGAAYSMLGQFEEAVPFFEAALEVEYKDDYLFQLAYIYVQLEEHQKAIIYLEELRTLNPHYSTLYIYLGEALMEEERLEEAMEVFEAGIKENPYQIELYLSASETAYRLHDSRRSEELLVQALELGDKQDDVLLTLSSLYLDAQQYEEAITLVNEMEDTENPYALWNLAHAYNALEEYDAAAVNYKQAYQRLNHEPDFLKEYAIFLRQDGQLQLARELLEHFLHHEPGDLEALSLLEDLSER